MITPEVGNLMDCEGEIMMAFGGLLVCCAVERVRMQVSGLILDNLSTH